MYVCNIEDTKHIHGFQGKYIKKTVILKVGLSQYYALHFHFDTINHSK